MDVREERQETEHGDNLELQLLRLVRETLRQRVQPQEEVANHQYDDEEQDSGADQKPGALAWRRHEGRERMRGGRVKRITHGFAPMEGGKPISQDSS